MSRLTRMAPGLIGLALAVPTAARAGLPPATQGMATPWIAQPAAARPAEGPPTPTIASRLWAARPMAAASTGDETPSDASPGDAQPAEAPPLDAQAPDSRPTSYDLPTPPVPRPNELHHPAAIDPRSLQMMKSSNGRIPAPPGVTLGICNACQSAETPGYAVAGGGMHPGYTTAPGYAVAGGLGSMGEPVPIGVVQAGYRPMGIPSPAGIPGPAPGAAFGPDPMNQGSPVPFAGPLAQPRHRRSSIFAHMLGISDLGVGRANERRYQEARTSHAATAYGPTGGGPSELPSSMVYGGR